MAVVRARHHLRSPHPCACVCAAPRCQA
jgi:hypothetical protein